MKAAPLIEFDEAAHAYKLNGKAVPSVTTVLDWALSKFDMVDPDVLEAARVFGNHVHQACHLYNIGDLYEDSLDERLAAYLAGYKKFRADTGFRLVHTEHRIGSPKYGYAGTLDLSGMLSGRPAVIDIKSTASLPRTVGLQTAGYLQGLLETTPEPNALKRARRFCLHLKPNDYLLVELDGLQDFNWFLSVLNTWRFWNSPAVA